MLRGRGLAVAGTPSVNFETTLPSACENSDGITKILFASPCASWGSICRYW